VAELTVMRRSYEACRRAMALHVGRERRRDVVGLDDQPARLDDLALDLSELFVGLAARHGRSLYPTPATAASRGPLQGLAPIPC
jgi:hypothetical protein